MLGGDQKVPDFTNQIETPCNQNLITNICLVKSLLESNRDTGLNCNLLT